MAKTAAERRTARKRKQQHRSQRRSGDAAARSDTRALIGQLVTAGAWPADDRQLDRIVAELASLAPDAEAAGQVTDLLLSVLGRMWELGWQPVDAVHVVRREGPARVTRLAVAVLARHAAVTEAATRAPEEWIAQLSALGVTADPHAKVVARWRETEGLDAATAWRDVLRLVGRWGEVPELTSLGPPPSRWGRSAPRRHATRAGQADPRMLARIRALLAKAESTEFPEEAEALTTKAQELMTRYAVDATLLDAADGASLADSVRPRRVHVDNPYADAKAQLLDVVGDANGVRVIWQGRWGMATAVGLPVDLDLTELLFTSLLVQATRAMGDTGRAGGRRTRSPSFRRSFLLSYALRIGERLADARGQAEREAEERVGTSLVPVLTARSEAVDDVVSDLFPELTTVERRILNAQGWHAGRLAADDADLRSGREQVTG
ncbi:DUF2786 domain-containing protein [Geodermatophilus sp. DF01-2]|uniref:DUF2786 domain-containing protein n=1 Tax=Geodermatophilus sp. DF01-2 TaxID=2559610 RepID=UPI00107326E9|nr:DUF2786 domain-containing protein [Geodermatophilus sp. DF01_2]TFV62736.1 DUF2786 domain-containing protein [Geodermatophilus sp. DF01_2]